METWQPILPWIYIHRDIFSKVHTSCWVEMPQKIGQWIPLCIFGSDDNCLPRCYSKMETAENWLSKMLMRWWFVCSFVCLIWVSGPKSNWSLTSFKQCSSENKEMWTFLLFNLEFSLLNNDHIPALDISQGLFTTQLSTKKLVFQTWNI